jgi:hypothetical protein
MLAMIIPPVTLSYKLRATLLELIVGLSKITFIGWEIVLQQAIVVCKPIGPPDTIGSIFFQPGDTIW